MPPGGFSPFFGNTARAPMQMGGMARAPFNMSGGMGRSPLNMLSGGMNQNSMQMMGRMSRLGSSMPMRAGGMNAGGRGLISRLFQRAGVGAGNSAGNVANVANAASGFQRAAGGSGGLLKGLANPGAIGSFLNNTQNVLRTAQQIGPMVQQYGPLVKNLPAMWRMYRSFKSTDSDETSEKNSDVDKESSSVEKRTSGTTGKNTKRLSVNKQKKKRQNDPSEDNEESLDKTSVSYSKGASVPKLYI